MRISGFLMCLSIILVIGIVYVWQRTEMVKVSYNIIESENSVSLLLDQNRNLVYNVDSMESPRNLDMKLADNEIKFEMANDLRVINLSGKRASVYGYAGTQVVQNIKNFVFQTIGNFGL
ncbi:MAG: hypothetical protein HYY56_03645 [Candidatus Omnitrophica bacterium]|nr:hypothetical protein [Candidatus Omnitrophota bacterium]